MSNLQLNRDLTTVDIEPAAFSAHSLNPFGMRVGKLSLELDSNGFRLLNRKGKLISTVLWIELEKFTNEVREKGRFSFHGTIAGLTDATGKVRVGLAQVEDRERLASIFDQLPVEVTGLRCTACGGALVKNVCRKCGTSFAGEHRRKGLKADSFRRGACGARCLTDLHHVQPE